MNTDAIAKTLYAVWDTEDDNPGIIGLLLTVSRHMLIVCTSQRLSIGRCVLLNIKQRRTEKDDPFQ